MFHYGMYRALLRGAPRQVGRAPLLFREKGCFAVNETDFWRTLFVENRRLNAVIKEMMVPIIARYDLSPVQSHLLGDLKTSDGQPINGLSSALCMKPSNFTPLWRSLEARGLVERRQDESDRRCWRLYLTEEGRILTKRVEADIVSAFSSLCTVEGKTGEVLELQCRILDGFAAFHELVALTEGVSSETSHRKEQ